MKQIIKYAFPALLFVLLSGTTSCSDMDDYLKYTDGKSILYTGRVDSVKFQSGNGRVVFNGLLTSDPKITKVKLYWNTRADSLTIDINRTSGVDTLNVSIPLPEGRYNFEVISFDNKNNPSISVNAAGTSYGDDYKQNLYNRVIKNAEKIGNDATINWYNGNESSPFVRIDYIDSDNNTRIVKVPTSESKTILENFKSMSQFKMQTYYLPDETAIDTFKAEYQMISVREDITGIYIKNQGSPFLRADNGTGKWGILKDWTCTSNLINQDGDRAGAWSTDAGGVIHFESKDWGGDGVTNGKVYQTMTLSAGIYSAEFYSDGGGANTFNGNFVAAEGTGLPDIGDQNGVVSLYEWNQGNMGGTRSMKFTLESIKTISIGWVVTFGSNTWMHVNYIKLISLNE